MSTHYTKLQFDTQDHNFLKSIQALFGVAKLENIHENLGNLRQFTMKSNSDTKYHKLFYSRLKNDWPEFEKLYDDFMRGVVYKEVQEEFIYQKWPTLRIHVTNNWATPEYHRDSQEGYNHPLGEINFLLPLTRCYDTNTLWTESASDKGDFAPVKMEWGDLVTFNGSECRHGNKINDTPTSRVSFDFRVLPLRYYDPTAIKISQTTNTRFEVGHYYKELKKI